MWKTMLLMVRLSLAGVFLWFAIGKALASGPHYPTILAALPRMGTGLQRSLIVAEAALGTWLLVGKRVRASALVTIFALCVFSAVIGVELTKEHPKPCGCMGAAEAALRDPVAIRRGLILDLARNGVLVGFAIILYARDTDASGGMRRARCRG